MCGCTLLCSWKLAAAAKAAPGDGQAFCCGASEGSQRGCTPHLMLSRYF